jgi:hypothetical protein
VTGQQLTADLPETAFEGVLVGRLVEQSGEHGAARVRHDAARTTNKRTREVKRRMDKHTTDTSTEAAS